MTAAIADLHTAAAGSRARPLLDNGDRLSRAEFERRYRGMPEIRKAELAAGFV